MSKQTGKNDDKEKAAQTASLEEMDEFEPPTPPDGGWGWAVMIASFFSNMIVDGVCYTFGIFFPELVDTFGASKSVTALVGALVPGTYLLVGKCVCVCV
jgi:MFS transporter, MCT family, solute carrier family 16 (monocarboxylic acid transporters), member 14